VLHCSHHTDFLASLGSRRRLHSQSRVLAPTPSSRSPLTLRQAAENLVFVCAVPRHSPRRLQGTRPRQKPFVLPSGRPAQLANATSLKFSWISFASGRSCFLQSLNNPSERGSARRIHTTKKIIYDKNFIVSINNFNRHKNDYDFFCRLRGPT
jgi:hypothetical protein